MKMSTLKILNKNVYFENDHSEILICDVYGLYYDSPLTL